MIVLAEVFLNSCFGNLRIPINGIAITITSTSITTSANVTAEAPVSKAKLLSFSIPLELAIFTLCPAFEYCRIKVPPICPAPIIPIFILFDWLL